MSTLLQLINEVLRRTGQLEAATLANAQTPVAQTIDFLNETYFEMLQRLKTERLIKTASIETVNGTAAYNPASDAEIDSILGDALFEMGSGNRLWEADYTFPLAHGASATGQPECFYRSAGQIAFYPVPDDVYTIQYQYLAKPEVLANDDDHTQLPAEWEKVLVLGTHARLQNFLGEGGQDAYVLYRDALGQLKSRSPLKPKYRMRGFYRGYS